MYVYIIQSGVGKRNPVKIGMSDDPEKRIKTLQTGNPNILRLLISIKCNSRKHAYDLEKALHQMLSKKNILNEWFRVNEKSLFETINRFANNPDIKQVSSHLDLFDRKEDHEKRNKSKPKKQALTNKDIEANRIKNLKAKGDNKDIAIFNMEKKLTKRKEEAKIFRRKLSELGVTYKEMDEMLGRK